MTGFLRVFINVRLQEREVESSGEVMLGAIVEAVSGNV